MQGAKFEFTGVEIISPGDGCKADIGVLFPEHRTFQANELPVCLRYKRGEVEKKKAVGTEFCNYHANSIARTLFCQFINVEDDYIYELRWNWERLSTSSHDIPQRTWGGDEQAPPIAPPPVPVYTPFGYGPSAFPR